MRAISAGLLTAVALLVAGCGGDTNRAAEGASIVSASAPAFVSIDSNLDSDQWQATDDLLKSFPGRSQLLQSIRSLLTEAELDYETDIEPALGDEIDCVWLDFDDGGENAVAITQPEDEDAFRRLVQKANRQDPGDDLLIGEVNGWLVLADSQDRIDRFREQAGDEDKLADDPVFEAALGELPDDALVRAYARGEDAFLAFQELAQASGAAFGLDPARRPEFLAAALAAEGDGMRLVGAARSERGPASESEPYESQLLPDVPGDAVAFLTFRGGEAFAEQRRQLDENPFYRELLRGFESELGFSVERIFGLFENEIALYVRPQVPIPELTLLLQSRNEDETRAAIDDVLTAISRAAPAQPCHEPERQAGVEVRCIELDDFSVRSAVFEGKAVVTTGAQAISAIRSADDKLPDDERFDRSRDAAGLPGETPGFVWIDLEGILPMVVGLADAAEEDVPASVRANLEPLQSFLAWSELDGRTSRLSAFLEID
jgi:hypothetical protein